MCRAAWPSGIVKRPRRIRRRLHGLVRRVWWRIARRRNHGFIRAIWLGPRLQATKVGHVRLALAKLVDVALSRREELTEGDPIVGVGLILRFADPPQVDALVGRALVEERGHGSRFTPAPPPQVAVVGFPDGLKHHPASAEASDNAALEVEAEGGNVQGRQEGLRVSCRGNGSPPLDIGARAISGTFAPGARAASGTFAPDVAPAPNQEQPKPNCFAVCESFCNDNQHAARVMVAGGHERISLEYKLDSWPPQVLHAHVYVLALPLDGQWSGLGIYHHGWASPSDFVFSRGRPVPVYKVAWFEFELFSCGSCLGGESGLQPLLSRGLQHGLRRDFPDP